MVELVPLKSNRVASSRGAWSTALRTSWRSTSDTTSKDGMAATLPGRYIVAPGSVPEWPKGADCKSAGIAFGGSNPPRPTAGSQLADVADDVGHDVGRAAELVQRRARRPARGRPSTRLATLSPGWKFECRRHRAGPGRPATPSRTRPGVGSVAVRLSTTPVAPAGTPARPATCTSRVSSEANGAGVVSSPVRESSRRCGLHGRHRPPARPRSSRRRRRRDRCRRSRRSRRARWRRRSPSLATTRLGRVRPGDGVEARRHAASAAPLGQTVTNPALPGSTAVTLTTTALASAGTPPRPATGEVAMIARREPPADPAGAVAGVEEAGRE